MQYVTLGRTGLRVSRTAFGALPVQRVDFDTAGAILRRAYDHEINFFDTARGYTDSEEKIGRALGKVRDRIIIATKSGARDAAGLREHLEISLKNLQTDYVDVLQLHQARELPDADDPQGAYAGLVEAQKQGKVRYLGLTAHRREVALAAARSGLFDVVQFPLSAISSDEDLELIDVCREHNVGLLAMKALCGGLLTDIPAAFAFLRQFENVVPLWGIQRISELDEFLALEADPPPLDEKLQAAIARQRRELAGEFCRGCGYCLPCPQEIPIPMAARMGLLLRRAPSQKWLTPEWREKMARVEDCTECRQCQSRCPYNLDIPPLLKRMYADYQTFV